MKLALERRSLAVTTRPGPRSRAPWLNTLALGRVSWSRCSSRTPDSSSPRLLALRRMAARRCGRPTASAGSRLRSTRKTVAANASVSLNVTSSNSFASCVAAIVAFRYRLGQGEDRNDGGGRAHVPLELQHLEGKSVASTTLTFDLPLEPDLDCIVVGYTDAKYLPRWSPWEYIHQPSDTFADRVQISLREGLLLSALRRSRTPQSL